MTGSSGLLTTSHRSMTELTFALVGSRQAGGEFTSNPCPGEVKERGTHQVYSGSRDIFSLNMKESSILVISVIIKLQRRRVYGITYQESTVTQF